MTKCAALLKPLLKVEFALSFFILIILLSRSDFTQLEKQVHEDEDFARTLAMLDEEPQAKKVILKNTNSNTKEHPFCDISGC